jgi:transposase
MNKSLEPGLNLPGLESGASLPPPPKAAQPAPARVKPVDRSQVVWRPVDVQELIAEDHPARAIWALTGELDLKSFYTPIEAVEGIAGRTPWDPRLLVSLWVYAYSRGISSAREIARRCAYEPAFQWLCGLEVINHHTLSDFRVAHGPALQELFVEVLGVLSVGGLVSLERVMQDGTKIKACASADTFRREESLLAHLEAARQQVQALAQEANEEPTRQQAAQQRAARQRQQRVEQALEQLEEIRQTKREAKEKEAARVSTSDPTSRTMKQADGGFAPSYNAQITTEASHKIIVGVGVSQSGNDYGELSGGVERIEQNLGAKPQQIVVDGGFTCRENILAMAAQDIELIGSWRQPAATATGADAGGVSAEFGASAFQYEPAADCYRCPAGALLPHQGQREVAGGVRHDYRAGTSVCKSCAFKSQCCPQTVRGRSISRLVEDPQVRQFREKMQTSSAQEIYRQRAPVAEFPNAWIKDKLGLRQFRLRGLVKVGWELLWVCLTYNIQQWIRFCWRPSLVVSQN